MNVIKDSISKGELLKQIDRAKKTHTNYNIEVSLGTIDANEAYVQGLETAERLANRMKCAERVSLTEMLETVQKWRDMLDCYIKLGNIDDMFTLCVLMTSFVVYHKEMLEGTDADSADAL